MFITSILVLSIFGLTFGLLLSLASIRLKVEVDHIEEAVLKALPNTNCGACGFPGCAPLASAIVNGEAPTNACVSGGADVTEKVSIIMGVSAEVREKEVAVIMCKGGKEESQNRFIYSGTLDCKAAAIIAGGPKSCNYGCLGFGTCQRVCPFNAISMNPNSLPAVDEEKCTGCRLCAENCPKFIIKMIPPSNRIHIRCNSTDKGNITRKNCIVGCIACRKCVKVCPVNAITITENLAVIDHVICNNCRDCVKVCPTDTIENYFPDEPRYAKEYPKLTTAPK